LVFVILSTEQIAWVGRRGDHVALSGPVAEIDGAASVAAKREVFVGFLDGSLQIGQFMFE
jgi:hypothetical protein